MSRVQFQQDGKQILKPPLIELFLDIASIIYQLNAMEQSLFVLHKLYITGQHDGLEAQTVPDR
jgi:hypothetical protein